MSFAQFSACVSDNKGGKQSNWTDLRDVFTQFGVVLQFVAHTLYRNRIAGYEPMTVYIIMEDVSPLPPTVPKYPAHPVVPVKSFGAGAIVIAEWNRSIEVPPVHMLNQTRVSLSCQSYSTPFLQHHTTNSNQTH